ncbi:uncharacterized protein [Henckelia pumila]|uniref:uncharacterized protein n=1 Tax=Henckelia pumila TaxID=405737 RepID=UPI003C6E0398
MEYADEEGKISCPCNNCLNYLLQPLGLVEIHLIKYGIQQSYKVWDYHGEQYEHPPTEHEVLSDTGDQDEMIDVFADLTEPVEIGESSESVQHQGFQTENFDDMLKEIEKELYPGCAFPQALLPSSHYEAKRKLKIVGLQNFSVCGLSRWVDKNTNTKGKKIPKKVMRYFPLTPRLKRLYSSRHTARDMRWHDAERLKDDGVLRHPADGSAWKMFDEKFPTFAMDPRNVRLGLATDGFNPFGSMSTTYSMWPVMVVPYNMPPWKCMHFENMMLSLLIPGPTSPGKNMDIFLQPLIEELKRLWEGRFYGPSMIIMYALMSGWSTKGYKACPTCNEETPSKGIRSKIAYIGHRRFLPLNDPMRRSKQFDGKVEPRSPPRELNAEDILAQLEHVHVGLPGKHKQYGGVKRKRSAIELNWSKKAYFSILNTGNTYHFDIT